MSDARRFPAGTAASEGLAQCRLCYTLAPIAEGDTCHFCGESLELRHPDSLQRTLAYLLTAMLFYIPANLFPIMTTETLGQEESHTIASGVVEFWQLGSYPIAIVIFVASIIIPVLKMLALLWLCAYVLRPYPVSRHQLARIYQVTEFVGKWSMIDIFVVALMVALVQMGDLIQITPGTGATAFAAVVIFTILAARAFDLRLIWDQQA